MANKDNQTTKVTDRNGDERIIKRNKTKIGIIILIVLFLLCLIGVGIYFIVKAANKNEISDDNWEVATISEVREDILDGDGSEVGVFFYKNDSSITNFMLRDNTDFDAGSKGAGALSVAMEQSSNEMTWYGVEIPKTNELIEELLTKKVDGVNGEDEYVFYDQFEYLGAGTSLRPDMWVISSLTGTDNDADESFSVEDKALGSFSMSVETNDPDADDYDDNSRDVYFTDSSTDNGGDGSTRSSGTVYSISEGTTMFFNGEQLTGVVNSWGTVAVAEDPEEGDTTADTRDEYHDDYLEFLKEMISHNEEYGE